MSAFDIFILGSAAVAGVTFVVWWFFTSAKIVDRVGYEDWGWLFAPVFFGPIIMLGCAIVAFVGGGAS
jgi:cell division protein FtsX